MYIIKRKIKNNNNNNNNNNKKREYQPWISLVVQEIFPIPGKKSLLLIYLQPKRRR